MNVILLSIWSEGGGAVAVLCNLKNEWSQGADHK